MGGVIKITTFLLLKLLKFAVFVVNYYISAADSMRLSSSKFSWRLRKTHDRRRGVRIGPSRSSEVDDFRVI